MSVNFRHQIKVRRLPASKLDWRVIGLTFAFVKMRLSKSTGGPAFWLGDLYCLSIRNKVYSVHNAITAAP